jgi:hypothetical protein
LAPGLYLVTAGVDAASMPHLDLMARLRRAVDAATEQSA